MCYRCEVCSTVTQVRQPLLKIIKVRELAIPKSRLVNLFNHQTNREELKRVPDGYTTRTEIEKEIPACPLCYDGWKRGIPIEQLRQMHRPSTIVTQRLSGGSVIGFAEFPAGSKGMEMQNTLNIHESVAGLRIAGVAVSSPKEDRTAKFLEQEEGSRKPKPKKPRAKPKLKPLIKRGNENRKANQAKKKAESGG